MARIVWTERARNDLREIVEYISRDSRAYAKSFAFRLRKKVDRLSSFLESGRLLPEAPEGGVREVIVENYRVLYRIVADGAVILTAVHGARKLEPPSLP